MLKKKVEMTFASKNIVAELNKGEKLNGDNYDIWYRKIQYIFEEQETLETLDNNLAKPGLGNIVQHKRDLDAYQAQKKKNCNAHIMMLSSMQDDFMCNFKKYETTQDKFSGTLTTKLRRLTIKFDSYRKRPNYTMSQDIF